MNLPLSRPPEPHTTCSADSVLWAVATSEEVGNTPLAVEIGSAPLVLWRDAQNAVRALEDRCPHRRAPLSRGCVKDDGSIQCGYHGWSFDGKDGALKNIPNLKSQSRFPPIYRAAAYPVLEADGLVRVGSAANAPLPETLPEKLALPMPLHGKVNVTLNHEDYIAALLDDPGLLLNVAGIRFTPYMAVDPHEESGWIVMERYCRAPSLRPVFATSDFPASLLSRTNPLTGETHLTFHDAALRPFLHALIAPVPALRGTTAVRWRAAHAREGRWPFFTGRWARKPFQVRSAIDASTLRVTLPSESVTLIGMGGHPDPASRASSLGFW